jgi:acyl-homoserine lactone acylase PvdQ
MVPSPRARPLAASLAAACALALALLAVPASAGVIDAGSVLPPGQSGFVPQSGTNPRLTDQIPLFESFRFKPATFQAGTAPETLGGGVTITRDAFGVPTVTAGSVTEAWTAAGYAVAQDRLVELEFFRRSTSGTLAALLGKDRLQDDIVARRDYYTDRELDRQFARLPRSLRERFGAYAKGINMWMAKVAADPSLKPLEFQLLGLNPAPWTVRDSVRIGVQLARTIPSGDGAELDNARALKALGAKRFVDLLPLRVRGQVATIPRSEGTFPSQPGRRREHELEGFERSRTWIGDVKLPSAAASAATAPSGRSVIGDTLLPAHGGSNQWAIRAKGKRALLFNGPQLGFSIPELFVELEVHAPGLNVRGVTAPGIPVIGIGHNDRLAWGLTSGLTDDDDLYAEKLSATERYRFKGRTRKMTCRDETFAVAGQAAVKQRLCRTVHGPVQERAGSKTAFARRYAIWGRELDTLKGLAELNAASSVRAAEKAIAKVTWNENILVADDGGNIGWFHPGLLPLRPRVWDERLPFPGTGEAEWRGFLTVSQRPHVINPKQGWLANWNNMPSVAWTNGDSEAKERIAGPLHRAAFLFEQVEKAHRKGTAVALKAVDIATGTTAQQRPLLKGQLAFAATEAEGDAATVLNLLQAWDGNYDRTDANGRTEPGVAIWQEFKEQAKLRMLPRAARDWLGNPGSSHAFDAGGAAATALRRMDAGDFVRVAGNTARVLTARYGSSDPTTWTTPRAMYDVSVQGLAAKPALKFFDRGTWQQWVELGPAPAR